MARIHDITAEQRALAVLLRRKFKYTYRNIALKTNMSKTSVQRVIKRFDTKIQYQKPGEILSRSA